MKIIAINTVINGSTGKIAQFIKNKAISAGYEYKIAVGRGLLGEGDYLINKNKQSLSFSSLLSRLTGNHENYNHHATHNLLKWLENEKPDIVHLHNLHGNYININMLFKYLKKHQIPVVWTFHDSWPVTGQCTHFDSIGCDKWKTECHHCPLLHRYPKSWIFDRSRHKYKKKKKLFTSLNDLTIVTPSKWLANIVQKSFLGKKNICVINNGINLERFKPTISDLRTKYGIDDRIMILGVASPWSNLKGLDSFNKLADELDDRYRVVLAGTYGEEMSSKIVALPKITDVRALAALYTTADVMLNLTIADTFPTVNIEALSCGTPVITFDTGGCPEQVDEKSGIVVRKGDLPGIQTAIDVLMEHPLTAEDCIMQAEKFNVTYMVNKYGALYDKILLKQDKGEK